MSNQELKSLQEQMQQLMNQLAEQKARQAQQETKHEQQEKDLAEQRAKHEALSEKVEKEVKVIKVMIEHVDDFVSDLTHKVGELEAKLVRLAEHDAAMLIRLAQEFRRGIYAIVKGEGNPPPVAGQPSS